jgi:hypothetical protein
MAVTIGSGLDAGRITRLVAKKKKRGKRGQATFFDDTENRNKITRLSSQSVNPINGLRLR